MEYLFKERSWLSVCRHKSGKSGPFVDIANRLLPPPLDSSGEAGTISLMFPHRDFTFRR